MIKTSVIIPVYNTALYLEECIESVFNQTQKAIEVIAINDGSTDNSYEILLKIKEKYPDLIVLSQENHGLGYTRNRGMEIARGEYIYFLDSDDYIMEDTLEMCYEYASKNRLDFVFFDAINFDEFDNRRPIYPNSDDRHEVIKERDEVFSGIFFLEKYYRKTYEPAACYLYCSLNFLKENNIKFLPHVYFEDNEFYCKIMLLANRIMYIPQIFYKRRCRGSSITGTGFNIRKAKDHIEVINAITDLKDINGGRGWHVIKKINLSLLWHVASICQVNDLYNEDNSLSERIIKAWMRICGCDITSIGDLEDVCYIRKMCNVLPQSNLYIEKPQIELRLEQLLSQTFEQLPLKNKQNKVAVYGCGRYTDKVLNYYEKLLGTIAADIIFLDTYIKDSGAKYRNYPIYNVGELSDMKLDYILVSSPQFEEEMNNVIKVLYQDKFTVILLYGDLHIDI